MRNTPCNTCLLALMFVSALFASSNARADDFFPGIGDRLYPSATPAPTPPPAASVSSPAPAPAIARHVESAPAASASVAPAPLVSAPAASAPAVVEAYLPAAAAVASPGTVPAVEAAPGRVSMSLRELSAYLARTRTPAGDATPQPAAPVAEPVAMPAAVPVAASVAEPVAELAASSMPAAEVAAASPIIEPTPAAPVASAEPAVPVDTMLPRRIDVASTDAALSAVAKKEDRPTFTDKDPAFAGSDLFVGRSVKAPTEKYRIEIGVAGQVVPLNLVLASSRSALITNGVTAACASSTDPNCAKQAATYAGQALNVLDTIPDSQWAGIVAASKDPTALATTLKSVGVTSASDIAAVQKYLSTIPTANRTAAILLARHLADSTADVRLEPYANVDLKLVQLRLGVPISLGVQGSGTAFDLGNLNIDVATGWTFPVDHASLGVSVGLSTYLPTSTGSERVSMMSDLFQVSKYLYGYMTFAPYVVAGVDARWVSLQVHGDLWLQARVRSTSAVSNAEVFQYGTGLTILPHFPVSVIGQLEGLEGLHNAGSFRSLFVVTGLQFNVWHVRLGVAVQLPILDRAKENLGSYDGLDVGGLAKYTVLARTAAAF